MANIKFSQFTAEADINNFTGIVGYAGAVNTRISPADLASSIQPLIGPYLPLAAGAGNPLTDDLYIGDGSGADANLFFQTTGLAGDTVEIQSQGQQFLYHELGTDFKIGPNDDIAIDDSGSAGVTIISPTAFTSDIKDINNSAGNVGQMLVSKGGNNAGVQWVNAYKSIQTFVWTNGNPVAYVNFPPPPGTLPTNSGLPFDPTPLVDYNNLPGGITQADYNWTCVNNAGGDAGQIATFTLGQFAPDGVWRVSSANHWFDQNSFIEVIVEFVINGTGIQVTDERSNDGAGDKIYYGELYQEFSAGDTVSVFVTFQNSSTPNVTPFPSAAGNRPIEISFERIV
ncbi:hypothetical protein [Phenylobacterium sp.]|jgi:hypothetical protein|uniref:hypothetical protein n=1 Tax=Phenylobacterium sp. TaxID=1871053 RepID=UPI0025E8F540|nr:hypothetical protein [Phenylobacterium sp.]